MKNYISVLISLFLISQITYAESDSTAVVPEKNLTISGYVDAYYSYNLNNPENASNFGETGVGRIFDGYHNQIALGLAQLKLDFAKGKTNVVADLVFGPNGELANFGNTGTGLLIKQAYVSYKIADKLTVTAGQYGTHIGYELVDAPDNFHYSLSYLFGNGPFYHTGVKLDYAISDKISVMAGVVNGWDAIFDNNNAKSITAQLGFTPNDDFYAYVNWIGGNEVAKEDIAPGVSAYKNMFDLTTGYTLSEKFSIGINGAFGFNKIDDVHSNWGGAALYLQYNIVEQFALGIRGEYFDDTEGSQYLGSSYTGLTFTASYTSPSGAFTVKPEVRYDGASHNIYYSGENNSLESSQTTLGIAVIGKF